MGAASGELHRGRQLAPAVARQGPYARPSHEPLGHRLPGLHADRRAPHRILAAHSERASRLPSAGRPPCWRPAGRPWRYAASAPTERWRRLRCGSRLAAVQARVRHSLTLVARESLCRRGRSSRPARAPPGGRRPPAPTAGPPRVRAANRAPIWPPGAPRRPGGSALAPTIDARVARAALARALAPVRPPPFCRARAFRPLFLFTSATADQDAHGGPAAEGARRREWGDTDG